MSFLLTGGSSGAGEYFGEMICFMVWCFAITGINTRAINRWLLWSLGNKAGVIWWLAVMHVDSFDIVEDYCDGDGKRVEGECVRSTPGTILAVAWIAAAGEGGYCVGGDGGQGVGGGLGDGLEGEVCWGC